MKNFNFKQFAVAHGEKIVLGVVGLMVLLALAKTSWSTYKKKPDEITTKATNAERTIAQNQWPKEHQEKYTATNRLQGKISAMLKPIPGDTWRPRSGGGLAFSNDPSYSLYIKEKLLEEPKFLPVERLVATSFHLVGGKIVAIDEFGGECGMETEGCGNDFKGTKKSKKTKKGVFRTQRRGGTGGTGTPGAGGTTYPGPMPGMQGGVGGVGKAGAPKRPFGRPALGATGRTPMGEGGGCGGMGCEGGEGGEGGAAGAVVEAKGLRVVAVRGIFPIKKQLAAFEDALNLVKGYYESDPQQMVDILGFTLERQVSSDGGKTWSTWEKVDIEKNKETLAELNFETDVVALSVVHPEITSPLPERLLRDWGDEATHEALINYKLSKEGRERQKKLEELIAKQKELLKPKKKSSGFGTVRRDLRGEAQGLLGAGAGGGEAAAGGVGGPAGSMGYSPYTARMGTEFRQGMNAMFNPMGGDPDAVKALEREVTAAGDLILFRYFDFDVVPGLAYRYQVQLDFRNPLFEEDPNLVKLDAQKATGIEIVKSPLSKPSNAAALPADTHVFLANVEQQNSVRMLEPKATLRIYQWLPDIGTTVKGEIHKLQAGSFIAGVDKKTTRLDPGRQELLVNAETEFETRSVLLDIEGGRKQLTSSHRKELGLPPDTSGVRVFDEVVIVDKYGDLKHLDPTTNAQKQQELKKEQDAMAEAFDAWKIDALDVAEGGAAGVEGACGDAINQFGGCCEGEGGGKGARRGRRSRSRRSLSPQRRGGGQYPMGGMGPGGGYNPYGGAGKTPGTKKRSRRSRRRQPTCS